MGKKEKQWSLQRFNDSISSEEVKQGWFSDENGWKYYYEDGVYVQNNWIQDNGDWFFFDTNGYMLKDTWQNWKYNRYYFGADGVMDEQ